MIIEVPYLMEKIEKHSLLTIQIECFINGLITRCELNQKASLVPEIFSSTKFEYQRSKKIIKQINKMHFKVIVTKECQDDSYPAKIKMF